MRDMQTRTISNESLQPHNRNRLGQLIREAQAMADESGEVRQWVAEDGALLDVFVPKVLKL